MKKQTYEVLGMTCSACSSRVEKAVQKVPGVERVSVNLLTNSMLAEYHEDIVTSEEIIAAVVKSGYQAAESNTQRQEHKHESKAAQTQSVAIKEMLHRLVFSLVVLIPLMYVAMHEMIAHMFSIPVPSLFVKLFDGTENAVVFALTQCFMVLPILYCNRQYFERGFRNLLKGAPNMDSLIAVGSGAAMIYGIFALFRMSYALGHNDLATVAKYQHDLYFESAGMIVTLITLGKYLETRSKGKTSEAIEKLMHLAPDTAVIVEQGQERVIPISELKVNDIMVVRQGERIAADGVIIEGNASIDESAITGESIPVDKQAGDKVIGATMNSSGFLKIKAEKVGEDTTISNMIALVNEASASKAPIAKLADKIAGVFVPIVMVIALLTGGVWLLAGQTFEFALSMAICVLVISCPCALGLATPVAIMVGTGKGAEHGILIKSGEALETAHLIDTVVMDKTGTITEGKPQVTDVFVAAQMQEQTFLQYAVSLEHASEHPLAKAIVAYGVENNSTFLPVEEFHATFGRGVSGKINHQLFVAGNEAFMKEQQVEVSAIEHTLAKVTKEGKTPLLFAKEHTLLGMIAVADKEKPSSYTAIKELENMGLQVIMLTGDHAQTAEAVRKRLGINQVIAQVLPEDKEKHIKQLQEQGHKVAMIGDGINDAPALARADVGIAIGAGTEIAIESADAVLVRNDLQDAVSAIKLSKAVIRNIKENLFWAFFYNVIGIPVAAGVLYPLWGIRLSPMIGALAMSLSSVCVVGNALRLKRLRFSYKQESSPLKQTQNKSKQQEEKKMKYELTVEGMMCMHCQKHVTDALMAMEHVTDVKVNLEEKKAYVEAETEIAKETFAKVIEDEGYTLVDVQS